MSPERVENLIAKKLEKHIRSIAEIKEIHSTSSTGESIIHVEIQDRYFSLVSIWQAFRNKVLQAQAELPQGTHPSQVNNQFGDVGLLSR